MELLRKQIQGNAGHCDLFQWHNCLAPSIFQSEIRLDGVSNQRHVCCWCDESQTVAKPFQKRNAKTRGREERAGSRGTSPRWNRNTLVGVGLESVRNGERMCKPVETENLIPRSKLQVNSRQACSFWQKRADYLLLFIRRYVSTMYWPLCWPVGPWFSHATILDSPGAYSWR